MFELKQQNRPDLRSEQQYAKSVLIVDDEAIIRDLCSKALKGYRVFQARDGEEALKVFQKGEIDVILTDVMMPKMGGIELLRRLKEIEPTLVVIIMTGFAEKDMILNALKADADDFITKPLNLLQLKTAVDKALVKKALKEEIANLKSMDRFKTNFLSIVSHKFRTPITAISLFLQNLANGVYDSEDPMYQKNQRLIYDEACYLERLVSELLAFNQAMDDGTGLKPEPCNLAKIITELLQSSIEAAGKPGVETSRNLDMIPPLLLDSEKIAFALKQILDNAYKFSGEKGTVAVSLGIQEDLAVITVQDTGVGIAKEDIPKLFEKFFQVDSTHTGQVRGFGLGLYYAKEFIRLHGGNINIESEPWKGTTVIITIPVREA
jgi:two-component system, sensor histidine kinase and response regulator